MYPTKMSSLKWDGWSIACLRSIWSGRAVIGSQNSNSDSFCKKQQTVAVALVVGVMEKIEKFSQYIKCKNQLENGENKIKSGKEKGQNSKWHNKRHTKS